MFATDKVDGNYTALKTESERKSKLLQEKLECFGIDGKIKSVTVGPIVTLFEYQPGMDTKINKIVAREHDLAQPCKR